jgi:hypothetical protein
MPASGDVYEPGEAVPAPSGFFVSDALVSELSDNSSVIVSAVESSNMAQSHLRKVQRRAAQAQRAREQLADAILAAHDAGESTRGIAPFAGMSHSRVHDLLVDARERAGRARDG